MKNKRLREIIARSGSHASDHTKYY